MTHLELITEIEKCAKANNIAPATVTGRAVGNNRLYNTLKNGGSCTISIGERLISYIKDKEVVHVKSSGDKNPLMQGAGKENPTSGDAV